MPCPRYLDQVITEVVITEVVITEVVITEVVILPCPRYWDQVGCVHLPAIGPGGCLVLPSGVEYTSGLTGL
jgi:hypothetical protein